jgi:ubiquinone/menaquinone biosynthesis C-methylase UbiE
MSPKKPANQPLAFLDMQALVGVTKHPGGFAATDELLALCHIEAAAEVLSVGCGIGVAPAYVAREHGCRVVGVDISQQMIEWSRQRAHEEHVADRVDLQVADALALPFAAGRFDVVFCESVLIFIAHKEQAIAEMVRVTRPGGYVGINEMFWLEEAPPELETQARALIGSATAMPTLATWQALWDKSGLHDRVVRSRQVDPTQELKDRVEWIGWRWLLRAWGRALPLVITWPGVRQSIKEQFNWPPDVMAKLGYGLFAGRR